MKEPIKGGDECIVINGALGTRSPNIGRRVIVLSSNGDDLRLPTRDGGIESLGRIWRCRSQDGKPFVKHDPTAHPDVPPDQADYPTAWLQKADPLPPAVKTTTRELENA